MMIKLVVGLGDTGISILEFLRKKKINAIGFDTRAKLPNQAEIRARYSIPVFLEEGEGIPWAKIDELLVSPGVDLRHPVIAAARARGLPIIGDIELFYREARAPIIAITGTNAKSTVTTLVTEMINSTEKTAMMGGNIGRPALELLNDPLPDYYVLELSSFQLELVDTFRAFVAIVLNISPDHLDRHHTYAAYCAAKMRIYLGATHAIENQGPGELPFAAHLLSSGLSGAHNLENARNALALTQALELPLAPQLKVLQTFKGLPHRCVLVRTLNGVAWYNDSKGTNVGATLAAIEGIGSKTSGKLVVLLGGVAKDQDFCALQAMLMRYARAVIIYGAGQQQIMSDLQKNAAAELLQILYPVQQSFVTVLQQARALAKPGDAVLFSPACASFDMFKNFEDRGAQFTQIVMGFQ